MHLRARFPSIFGIPHGSASRVDGNNLASVKPSDPRINVAARENGSKYRGNYLRPSRRRLAIRAAGHARRLALLGRQPRRVISACVFFLIALFPRTMIEHEYDKYLLSAINRAEYNGIGGGTDSKICTSMRFPNVRVLLDH